MTTFLLEIITPDRVAFSDNVEMVSVPSAGGILGILAGHSPLFSKLLSGELKILKDGQESFVSLGEGFMEVGKEKVKILVTKALHAEEIDEEKLLQAKKEAEEALKNPPSPEQQISAEAMLKSILSDLKVARRRRQRHLNRLLLYML